MNNVKKLGGALLLLGVVTCILNFMGYNLKILMWIDNWGSGTGWGIRVGMIVVGSVLVFLGSRMDKPQSGNAGQQPGQGTK